MMTTAVSLSSELQRLVDFRLDTIDRILLSRVGRSERKAILAEIESQIFEMFNQQSSEELTREDVLSVLAKLDPPESYLEDDASLDAMWFGRAHSAERPNEEGGAGAAEVPPGETPSERRQNRPDIVEKLGKPVMSRAAVWSSITAALVITFWIAMVPLSMVFMSIADGINEVVAIAGMAVVAIVAFAGPVTGLTLGIVGVVKIQKQKGRLEGITWAILGIVGNFPFTLLGIAAVGYLLVVLWVTLF